jgi:hypothetical protein
MSTMECTSNEGVSDDFFCHLDNSLEKGIDFVPQDEREAVIAFSFAAFAHGAQTVKPPGLAVESARNRSPRPSPRCREAEVAGGQRIARVALALGWMAVTPVLTLSPSMSGWR